jgi:hypothetical protein
MTRLYNLNINNTTLPALDNIKRKHENGGILKYQNPSSPLLNAGYTTHDDDNLRNVETFNKN